MFKDYFIQLLFSVQYYPRGGETLLDGKQAAVVLMLIVVIVYFNYKRNK